MGRSNVRSEDEAFPTALRSRTDYRGFIIAAVVVTGALFAAAWIWAVKGRMWFLDAEYPMWVANADMSRTCPHGAIAILGDSRAKAGLMPSLIGPSVANFALGGGTPIDAYYLTKRILECPVPPKDVIVSFSLVYFMNDMEHQQLYWGRSALFGSLSLDDMEEVRRTSWQLKDSMIYPTTGRVTNVLGWIKNVGYAVRTPSYYFPAMVNAGFMMRKGWNEEVYRVVIRNRGQHLFGTAEKIDWTWTSEEARYTKFRPSPLLNHYFSKTVLRLLDRGIRIWYVGMPLSSQTSQAMRQDVRDDFRAYLQQFVSRGGFRIVGDVFPVLSPEYFGDNEHLNRKGATAWSNHIADQLTRLGVDGAQVSNAER